MTTEATPGNVPLSDQLGQPPREGFDEYAFLADFDITRSTCGQRAGRYASEVTQRAYMVWADQQREISRLREALVYVAYASQGTPQYMLPRGVALIDGHTVEVRLNAGVVVTARH